MFGHWERRRFQHGDQHLIALYALFCFCLLISLTFFLVFFLTFFFGARVQGFKRDQRDGGEGTEEERIRDGRKRGWSDEIKD